MTRNPFIQCLVHLGLLLAIAPAYGQAQKTSPPKAAPSPKSIYNTNIYENTDGPETFTDTVKLVREMAGTQQVFFNKMPGAFTAPSDETAMAKIIESQTKKTSLKIYFDSDTRKILRVAPAPDGKIGR